MDLPNDRSSAQLRAYLRDEYRAEIAWLDREVRSQLPSRRGWLGRWLAARQARRERPSARVSSDPSPETPPSPSARDAEDCAHLLTEDLGLSGGAGFLRCAICGDVIVVRGGRRWRIGSETEEPASVPAGPATGEDVSAATCEPS